MLTNEKYAPDKWCPFVRRDMTGGNRDASGKLDRASNCIGSSCMAWRWHEPASADVGYCGLAGVPYARNK